MPSPLFSFFGLATTIRGTPSAVVSCSSQIPWCVFRAVRCAARGRGASLEARAALLMAFPSVYRSRRMACQPGHTHTHTQGPQMLERLCGWRKVWVPPERPHGEWRRVQRARSPLAARSAEGRPTASARNARAWGCLCPVHRSRCDAWGVQRGNAPLAARSAEGLHPHCARHARAWAKLRGAPAQGRPERREGKRFARSRRDAGRSLREAGG